MTKQVLDNIRTPRSDHKISIDDWLVSCEMAAIEREKLTGNNGSDATRYCDCAETLSPDGHRWPCQPGHSCAYVKARNELIGEASRIATENVGGNRGIVNGYRWTREFVRQMERLAAPLLNGVSSKTSRLNSSGCQSDKSINRCRPSRPEL
jgi:hypothetical protein